MLYLYCTSFGIFVIIQVVFQFCTYTCYLGNAHGLIQCYLVIFMGFESHPANASGRKKWKDRETTTIL